MPRYSTRTIYTIEVIPVEFSGRWYASKGGQQFEAELVMKDGYDTKEGIQIMFRIDALRSIRPSNCKVISEKKMKSEEINNNY